jgi:septum formation protein
MINLDGYNLVLASESPRRRALLADLGLKFETTSADIDESFSESLLREEIPMFLAKQKAEVIKSRLKPKDILITADTIVWINNKAVNKPEDRADAFKMISALSDNVHSVYTGVQITTLEKELCFFAETKVFFSKLEASEINYYLDTYQPYDKAGAYGIQEWIGYVGIERIEGSYFNVMGLPVHQVYKHLKHLLS